MKSIIGKQFSIKILKKHANDQQIHAKEYKYMKKTYKIFRKCSQIHIHLLRNMQMFNKNHEKTFKKLKYFIT